MQYNRDEDNKPDETIETMSQMSTVSGAVLRAKVPGDRERPR